MKFASIFVEKMITECASDADAAIGGGAPAQTDENFSRTTSDSVAQKNARPVCAREQWIAVFRLDAPQAAGLAHFDDGEMLAFQPRVARSDGATVGVFACQLNPLRSECGSESLGETFAPIGNRCDVHYGIGEDRAKAALDGLGGGECGEGAFEFIGSNQESHGVHSVLVSRSAVKPRVLNIVGLPSSDASATVRRTGGVAEWSNALVLKTGRPQGLVGSNPTPSAISHVRFGPIQTLYFT